MLQEDLSTIHSIILSSRMSDLTFVLSAEIIMHLCSMTRLMTVMKTQYYLLLNCQLVLNKH